MSKSKLSPVSWAELVKRLRLLGFDGPYQGGKQPYRIKDYLQCNFHSNGYIEAGKRSFWDVQTPKEFLESR